MLNIVQVWCHYNPSQYCAVCRSGPGFSRVSDPDSINLNQDPHPSSMRVSVWIGIQFFCVNRTRFFFPVSRIRIRPSQPGSGYVHSQLDLDPFNINLDPSWSTSTRIVARPISTRILIRPFSTRILIRLILTQIRLISTRIRFRLISIWIHIFNFAGHIWHTVSAWETADSKIILYAPKLESYSSSVNIHLTR